MEMALLVPLRLVWHASDDVRITFKQKVIIYNVNPYTSVRYTSFQHLNQKSYQHYFKLHLP